jgi:calcium-dependent protein kinase
MIIKQVLSGIAYCHDKDVAHRDLKPENILISKSKQIKIIDFGLSTRFYSLDRMNLNIGTLAYRAPEVFEMDYDEKCDMWSIGVILYMLLA